MGKDKTKVVRGVADFVRSKRPGLRATFQRLAHGQEPVALLVACSDSRIVSSLLLGTEPGDIFEVRTVGNLVAPAGPGDDTSTGARSEAAAIEYALLALEVGHVIVLGHSGCGAMKAITSGHLPKGAPNLDRWLDHARAAREKLERSSWIDPALPPEDRLSQANVLQQLEHIRSHGPVIERLARGELELHGGWFEVESADFHIWRAAEGRFVRVDEQVIAQALGQSSASPS